MGSVNQHDRVPSFVTDFHEATENLGNESPTLGCRLVDPELTRDPRKEPVGAGLPLKDHHHTRLELLLLKAIQQVSGDRAFAGTVLAEQNGQALALPNAAKQTSLSVRMFAAGEVEARQRVILKRILGESKVSEVLHNAPLHERDLATARRRRRCALVRTRSRSRRIRRRLRLATGGCGPPRALG